MHSQLKQSPEVGAACLQDSVHHLLIKTGESHGGVERDAAHLLFPEEYGWRRPVPQVDLNQTLKGVILANLGL